MDTTLQLLRAREFAEKAGVTVRTLHHYDRIGLLKPVAMTGSGHRLYGKNELMRLERIVALKFIGLPLRSIQKLLDDGTTDLATVLRDQHRAISKMRQHLDEVLRALDEAASTVVSDQRREWEALKNIIALMEMYDKMDWMKNYYTPEQLADLQSRGTPEVLAKAETDWKALLAEIEASTAEDPGAPHAQTLLQRWDALIERFTGGDEGIRQNLQRLYADRATWPADFKQPYSDAAAAFIAKARAARR